jgi:hypothetical protein
MFEKIKNAFLLVAGAVTFYGSIWLMLAVGTMAGF